MSREKFNMIFMQRAILNARRALKLNEVPVGCVIVLENKIIAEGFNTRNLKQNVLYHAEIIAINKACKKLNTWRLENTSLYVTLEPCAMCAGAILQARISKIFFGVKNKKSGCAGSVLNILDHENFNHRVKIISGLMEQECSELIKFFFKNLREQNKYLEQNNLENNNKRL